MEICLHKRNIQFTFASAFLLERRTAGRGAGVVTEQIANLSTGNRRQGSSPCLSATLK